MKASFPMKSLPRALSILGLAWCLAASACANSGDPQDEGAFFGENGDQSASTNSSSKKKKASNTTEEEEGKAALPPADPGGRITIGEDGGTSVAGGATSLASIAPTSSTAGTAEVSLTLTGTGFLAESVVKFGGEPVGSRFVSASQIIATLSASKLAQGGSFPVVVSTKGADSTPITFTVVSAQQSATISSVNPTTLTQYGGTTDITVSGSGFVSGANVVFNGTPLATTFLSANSLRGSVTSSLLQQAGSFPVSVSQNGSSTAPITITVTARQAPTVTGVNVTGVFAGRSATEVIVRGSGFSSASRVAAYSSAKPNGVVLGTTLTSATELTATVGAEHFATAGKVTLKVYDVLPDGRGLYATGTGEITVTGN
jgi:hypothetical protein